MAGALGGAKRVAKGLLPDVFAATENCEQLSFGLAAC